MWIRLQNKKTYINLKEPRKIGIGNCYKDDEVISYNLYFIENEKAAIIGNYKQLEVAKVELDLLMQSLFTGCKLFELEEDLTCLETENKD